MKLQQKFKDALLKSGQEDAIKLIESGLCSMCGGPITEEEIKNSYFGVWQMHTCTTCTAVWKKLSKFDIITQN